MALALQKHEYGRDPYLILVPRTARDRAHVGSARKLQLPALSVYFPVMKVFCCIAVLLSVVEAKDVALSNVALPHDSSGNLLLTGESSLLAHNGTYYLVSGARALHCCCPCPVLTRPLLPTPVRQQLGRMPRHRLLPDRGWLFVVLPDEGALR